MDVRHLSFRLLQVYVQVVRQASVSGAARTLHLTQPTVSLQLKRLAEAVGEPLLDARGGQMLPTAAGAELYRAACDVLGRFDDFALSLDQLRGGSGGNISIGLVTTAKYILPRILGPFYRSYPKVGVTLHIGNRARILARFENGEDDLYVFSHPPSGPAVLAARMLKNPLQLIAPAGHWAAGRESVPFAELAHERFLVREPGSATRMMFEAWLSGQGIEIGTTMQIESNEAIRLSVASGLGLAVVSAHTLQEGRDGLAVLRVDGLPIESHWYLVSRRDRRLPAAALSLVGFMAAHLPECVAPHFIAAGIGELAAHFAPAGAARA